MTLLRRESEGPAAMTETERTNRVLVTGAGGFLGKALCSRLLAGGRSVRGAVRAAATDLPAGTEPVEVGDIGPDTDWSSALADVDVVVHCAARAHVLRETATDPLAEFRRVNRDGAVALGRAAAEVGVRRLVFISTIGVNGGQTHGCPFRNDDRPDPHSPYAISKLEAEEQLPAALAGRTELVVIRPPLIYGPDPKGNLGTLSRLIRRGLPLPMGLTTRNRRDLVSLGTLCGLIEVCLDHPRAGGETFLVSDGHSISSREILEKLAADLDRPLRLLPVPISVLSLLLGATGRGRLRAQLLGDLEIDISHTRSRLDWRPGDGGETSAASPPMTDPLREARTTQGIDG